MNAEPHCENPGEQHGAGNLGDSKQKVCGAFHQDPWTLRSDLQDFESEWKTPSHV